MLASLLSTVHVPYHLLQLSAPCPNRQFDLNIYYLKIVSCLKQVEGVVVPLDQCPINAWQPVWNFHPELKPKKNKAKLWLQIWVACGRPPLGSV